VYIQPRLLIFQLGEQRHAGRAGVRLADADRARQRDPEHAEAVRHADAEMDGQGRRRHQPTIESRLRDDSLALKQPRRNARRVSHTYHCCSLPRLLLFFVFFATYDSSTPRRFSIICERTVFKIC
jgi:hypothetical protein